MYFECVIAVHPISIPYQSKVHVQLPINDSLFRHFGDIAGFSYSKRTLGLFPLDQIANVGVLKSEDG